VDRKMHTQTTEPKKKGMTKHQNQKKKYINMIHHKNFCIKEKKALPINRFLKRLYQPKKF